MFRRFLFIGTGVLAFIGMLSAPGQLYAQHGRPARGVSHQGFHPSFNRGFNPAIHRQFTPGFGFTPAFGLPSTFGFTPGFGFTRGFAVPPGFTFTPGIGFTPSFNGGFFDPRLNRARFDRFDRFEDRFERRFGFPSPFGFPTGFQGGFVPGFGFVPGTGSPFLSLPGFPIGIGLSLIDPMFL